MIGKIERIPLRDVWKHEAYDFTQWIEDNIDVLNNAVDLNLVNPEREYTAGSFSIDLVAEDENGNTVVIENQLEKSNHDHLGKLLTYLVSMDAKIGIWIVSEPRPEHINVVTWLNETSAADFYLIKVEAIRIEDSPPAPLFTLIVGPSEEGRAVGETKKQLAERHLLRKNFWTALLEKAKEKTKLHANLNPGINNWIGTGAGKTGLSFSYVSREHEVQVELYIDRGKDLKEENEKIFNQLYQEKEKIEGLFSDQLEWEKLESKRASRIRKRIDIGGYKDEDRWDEIHEKMIDAMMRLEKACRPSIQKLDI